MTITTKLTLAFAEHRGPTGPSTSAIITKTGYILGSDSYR